MEKRKVEFEFEPLKALAAIATIASVVTAGYYAASWFDDAGESHTIVEQLAQGQLQLQKEEELRQELWGDNYRKKITKILDKENETRSE